MSKERTPTSPGDAGAGLPGGVANQPCDGTTVACPAGCPTDFIIDAPCKILKANGGSVQMSVSEPYSRTMR